MSSREKDNLCDQLLEDSKAGRQLPRLTAQQLKKLEKHCKEDGNRPEPKEGLSDLLRNLRMEHDETLNDPVECADMEAPDVWMDLEDWFFDHGSDVDPLWGLVGDSAEVLIPLERESVIGPTVEDILRVDDVSDPITFQAHSSIIKQPFDKFAALSQLCRLGQQFYHRRLGEHQLHLHGLPCGPNATVEAATSSTSNDIYCLLRNKVFWTKVKSGMYYLKIDNEQLAMQELGPALPMIPELCEQQPLSLLKDILATISPVATPKNHPMLRIQLLREFRQSAELKLGHDHNLTELFRILCQEEGSDEVSVTMLRAMLDETKQVLQPKHPERFELQRTLVRLYRRLQNMSEAEQSAWSLIETCEDIYGKDHVNTRLALSECVYVYGDSGRLEDALLLAEDVLHRAQRDLGQEFPDYQSIYAMEDVSEICDKVGRIEPAIQMLRKASRAALNVWGNLPSTVHILDKLDALVDKRHQQALES